MQSLLRDLETGAASPRRTPSLIRSSRWAALGPAPARAVRVADGLYDALQHACQRAGGLALSDDGGFISVVGTCQGGAPPGVKSFVGLHAVPEERRGDIGEGDGEGDGGGKAPLAFASGDVLKVATGVCFAPGGAELFVVGELKGSVVAWDTAAFTPVVRVDVKDGRGEKVSTYGIDVSTAPDGDPGLVAVCGEGGTLRLVDLRTGVAVSSLAGHDGAVNDVCWSPTQGTVLASAGQDGTVRLFDVRRAGHASGLCVMDLRKRLPVASSGATAGGKRRRRDGGGGDGEGLLGLGMAWEATDATGDIAHRKRTARRKLTSGRAGAIESHECGVRRVRYTPDGRQILSCGQDGRMRVWDALTAHCVLPRFSGMPLQGFGMPRGEFELSRDGGIVIAAKIHGGAGLDLYDVFSGEALRSIPSGGYGRVTGIALHPKREEVYTSASDGEVLCWAPEAVVPEG